MTPTPGTSSVALRYLAAAAAAFIVAALGTAWLARDLAGHYYQPRLVALAHTVTLGWITLTIMGATYQLIPIVIERPIWSERLGRYQFLAMVIGAGGMVAHFYIGQRSGLAWAAGLVGLGVLAHLVNATLSVRGLRRWTFTARLIVLALAGLALTTVFGMLLAADRVWKFLPGDFFPTLHTHFHLALLGWVMPTVFGVAARVYPMFLLARDPEGWPHVQTWGLAVGVPAVVAGLLGVPGLLTLGALAVTAAVAGHVIRVARMLGEHKRPALDWGLRFALTGTAFLLPSTALGWALALDLVSGPRPALAYAVLALGGWVSLTIVGMMLKIVPFLVWYRVYAPHVGRMQVPTLARLSSPAMESVAYAMLTSGTILLAAAVAVGQPVAISLAGLALTLGALAFGGALARVLYHLAPGQGAARPVAPLGAQAR